MVDDLYHLAGSYASSDLVCANSKSPRSSIRSRDLVGTVTPHIGSGRRGGAYLLQVRINVPLDLQLFGVGIREQLPMQRP